AVSSVTSADNGAGKVFDIKFAEQKAGGQYRVKIGPGVYDRSAGKMMDQDRDGVDGEATQDQFSATFTINYRYRSAGGNQAAINDYQTARSQFQISSSGTIADLKVNVDIRHTATGDLRVYLKGPDGTIVQLFNRSGDFNDNLIATFDD